MLRVSEVAGRRDLRAFVDLPYRLYRRDRSWAPPLRREVTAALSPANPFFEHGEAAYYLARRGDRVVGRIAVIRNSLHDEVHADDTGFFGFFECEDDADAAAALVEAAGERAREKGYRSLRGPMSFSVNEECGLLVEGFDRPPTVLMAHNPPYYPGLLEAVGFRGVKDLLAYQGGHPTRRIPVPERLTRGTRLLQRRLGVAIRPLDPTRLEREIEVVGSLFNASWTDNWGFLPLSARELRHLAASFKPVLVPEMVPIAEIDGRPVGFGAAIPDLNEVLVANRSGRTLPGAIRVLWAMRRRRFRRLRILLLGILPEFRGRGLDAVLYHWIWTRAQEIGFRWGEAGWILEDNTAMNAALEKMGFRPYKRYRVYEKTL